MLRATHIRTKLGLALAVPLLALIVVAGFEVSTAVVAVDSARVESARTTVAIRASSLISNLQVERTRAVLDIAELTSVDEPRTGSIVDTRTAVDRSVVDLRSALTSDGATLDASFAAALDAIPSLESIRAEVNIASDAQAPNVEAAESVFVAYAAVIDALLVATSAVEAHLTDVSLRAGVAIVHAASEENEVRARMGWLTLIASAGGVGSAEPVGREVAALQERSHAIDTDLRASATGRYAAAFEGVTPGALDHEIDAFLSGRSTDTEVLISGMTGSGAANYTTLGTQAATILASRADQLAADSLMRQWVFGGIGLALFLVAPLLTWLAVRSVTRPLASLRRQAEDMAGVRLPGAVRQILDTPFGEDVVIPRPEPLDVGSRDEVAQVAAALSSVQTSALDLAVEQAVLRRNISDSYINLGRRNQNLLSRQLDFITELERNESDPDTLEGLFRLDHLATRMRRNAESLLVLAGVEPPRQWAAPVKVSDVVRAALGEVEDYQRVVIRHLEPAAVTGAVAADIAHITAELVENSLSFSPPEQRVEVKGRLTLDGYTIAISDNGFGMPAGDMERANRRLGGSESFTVAPSRYLGHYVAGHLASRLGIVVELQDSPAGGITARIDVPMGLVADDETDPRLNRVAPATPQRSAVPSSGADSAPTGGQVMGAPTDVAPEPEPEAATAASADPAEAPVPSFTASGLPRRGERGERADSAVEVVTGPSIAPPAREPQTTEPDPVTRPEAVPALGFGGLAITRPTGPSLFTVTARNARLGTPPTQAPEPKATPTGLTRRVPGAQRPDAAFGARSTERSWSDAEPAETSPDDVYSFLSSFQSGVERGRVDGQRGSEAIVNLDVDATEDG